jgi:hypothetical protein
MRSMMLSLLAAGQLTLGAQPALAASLGPATGDHTRVGVFAGAQVKLTLGGARPEAPRASLGIAPTLQSQRIDGASRSRIGEGLQLSLAPNRPVELNLAGTRLDRLGVRRGGETPDGPKSGVSTLGWVGIGVGVVVVAAGGFAFWLHEAMECGPSDDEC